MKKTLNLIAVRVAAQLDIKAIKSHLEVKPVAESSAELFYGFGPHKFQHYFNYGVIVFSDYTEDEIAACVKAILACLKNPVTRWLRETTNLNVAPDTTLQFDFNQVTVDRLDAQIVRIAMLNLAQSVALDFYHEVSENLLEEVRVFTNNLETTGKLKISRTNMMKFIGRALNTQNDIADNIYIFDAPEQVWEDEYLDKLHQGLIKHYDLRTRFNEIEYTLRIIEDNLSVFREISHQRESSLLEWIIIILILVEVFDLFISKLS
ncbi:MAG: RMD1 family protein [Bacteroidota bacterium]